jgi:hypothetical protein
VISLPRIGLLAVVLGTAACSSSTEPSFNETLDLSVCHQSQSGVSATVDNPWFPLPVGQRWIFEGEEDGVPTKLEMTVLSQTETVAGVVTRVLEERHTENSVLVEVSRNFFVQTSDGTVCYFGEDVDDYQNGIIVDHDGAWRAGVGGAVPGIFMPAQPAVGMAFRQEVAPGVAEDRVIIVAMGESTTVPLGTFNTTLRFLESTPLEPGAESTKVYASGLGMIVDDVVRLVSRIP